jgi:hypothetical protein
MTIQLPPIANAYVQAVNDRDPHAFLALFGEAAVVDDVGRMFHGQPAIKAWSDREIFDADVTLDVVSVTNRDGEIVITTKVDGNFDRTGLPDPVVIDHRMRADANKIVGLTCRLAGNGSVVP